MHCECYVIAFPTSIDQCHWIAVAGSHSIVRYGLGTGGQHEGIIFTTLTYPYMILPQYLPRGNKKKGLAIYGKFADATLILYMNYKVSNFSIAVGCGSQNLLSSNLQRVTLFIA